MTEDLKKTVEETRQRFIHIFRREPGATDRFDPIAYVSSPEDFSDVVVSTMKKTNFDPALTYAFRKTGRVVLSINHDLLPERDVQEWRDAIQEYEDAMEEGYDLLEPEPEPALDALRDEAERLPYLLGKLITDSSERISGVTNPLVKFQHEVALYAATRGAKSFQAIKHLIEHHLNEDALNVTRSIYESYLNLAYALIDPEQMATLVEAKIGLAIGTHRFAQTKSGKPNRRAIVEQATGAETRAEVTTYEMACASPYDSDGELHSYLYSFLSSYTHPHPLVVRHYVGPKGFTTTGRDGASEAFVLSMLVSGLLMDAAIQLPEFPEVARSDVEAFLRHLQVSLRDVHVELGDPADPLTAAILARIAVLGQPWRQ